MILKNTRLIEEPIPKVRGFEGCDPSKGKAGRVQHIQTNRSKHLRLT